MGTKFRQQFIGRTATILTENNNGQPCGRSERYFMVYLKKSDVKPQKNELLTVKLLENNENGMTGEILPQQN